MPGQDTDNCSRFPFLLLFNVCKNSANIRNTSDAKFEIMAMEVPVYRYFVCAKVARDDRRDRRSGEKFSSIWQSRTRDVQKSPRPGDNNSVSGSMNIVKFASEIRKTREIKETVFFIETHAECNVTIFFHVFFQDNRQSREQISRRWQRRSREWCSRCDIGTG